MVSRERGREKLFIWIIVISVRTSVGFLTSRQAYTISFHGAASAERIFREQTGNVSSTSGSSARTDALWPARINYLVT